MIQNLSWLSKFIIYAILAILIVLTLFPLIYILLSSVKEAKEIMAGGINFWPSKFTFDNYVNAWKSGNFSRYTINSIIYAIAVSIVNIFFCSMVGFCITRTEFFGKKLVSASYYGSMFVAGAVTIYPIFMILVKSGLNNTLFGMILATLGMGQSFGVLLISSYLSSIPKELDESATIDGCGPFRIYTSIIFPVIRPIIGVVAMITFQGTWNNYMLPLALTAAKPKLRPLAVGVTSLAYGGDGKTAGQWDLLIAGSCMAIIPIIIVYIFANRYFVSGIMSGAVKG